MGDRDSIIACVQNEEGRCRIVSMVERTEAPRSEEVIGSQGLVPLPVRLAER